MINEIIPPIDTFPNDDILRVVWACGAVYKNIGKTRVPEIKIMLKEILPSGELSKSQIFRKIFIAQLDIVRYMTIWRGNRRITSFWNAFGSDYASNILFSLDTSTSSSISFTEKMLNSNYSHFPPYKYKLDRIDDKNDYWSFANSTFTKIETFDGTTVIVPSMELLTSTYTPQEQEIRNKLIQKNLDDVLTDYIKTSSIVDSKYSIELYNSKNEANISFLAYTKFNLVTRQRLQKLRASIETGSPYPERYPVVLPYHPTNLDLKGDGIWLNKKTFFMFRINAYTLPIDNVIESYTQELEVERDESKNESKRHTRIPQNLEDIEIPITNEHNPHSRNGSQHIISEVLILNPDNGSIKHKKETLKIVIKTDTNSSVENNEDIQNISSGESDETTDSKNTGNIIVDEQDKSRLKQSEVLKLIIKAFEYLRDNQIDVSDSESGIHIADILFIDEECNMNRVQVFTQFLRVLIQAKRETSLWVEKRKIKDHKTVFLGFRNYMLIKVVFNNGESIYLFEIDRKDENESFLGMLFKVDGGITKDFLVDLLHQTMDEKGIVKKIKLPAVKSIFYGHKLNKDDNLNDSILNAFKKAMEEGLIGRF